MNISLLDRFYIWLAEKSWRFRKNTSRTIRISVNGQELRVPIDKGMGFDNVYYYREKLFPIVGLAVKYKKGAFIDIGANIGQMLINVLVEERDMKYVGFEPNLTCGAYIERLIELNELKDHLLVPIGLSNNFEVVDFLFNGPSDVCASTTPMFRPSSFFKYKKQVVVENGDTVLSKIHVGNIGVIKIDVEGGELEVLNGLTNTLKTYTPILLLEVLPYMHIESDTSIFPDAPEEERRQIIKVRQQRTLALEETLAGLGYYWYRIEENGNLLRRSSLGADGPEQRTEMNFMLVPQAEKIDFEEFVSQHFSGRILS